MQEVTITLISMSGLNSRVSTWIKHNKGTVYPKNINNECKAEYTIDGDNTDVVEVNRMYLEKLFNNFDILEYRISH